MALSGRVTRHVVLAAASTLVLGFSALIGPAASAADRVSIVSAYLCLLLLATTLAIGPRHVLIRGRPLTNSYLRRDIGVWAAITALLHFFLANLLSMNSVYLDFYVENATAPPAAEGSAWVSI